MRNPPVAPIDRIDPVEPIDRIDPLDAIDSAEPTDPKEATEPTDATDHADHADQADRFDPTDATESLERTDVRLTASVRRALRVGIGIWGASSCSRGTRSTTAEGRLSASLNGMTQRYREAFAIGGSDPWRHGAVGSASVAATTAPVLRRAIRDKAPSLAIEREMWAAGDEFVVGVDEVGRGAWAGPLMVGAAVLPTDRRVYKVRDSKMLTEVEREALFDRIANWCVAWAVGAVSHRECDELGMSEAQRLAARRAIEGLGVEVDQVLLDGKWDFVGGGSTRMVVRGDATCVSIAAASILAKVTRDRFMRAQAESFPGYDFASNKGYPCPRHRIALAGMGPTSIHRRSWSFMDSLPWTGVCRSGPDDPQLTLFG